VVFKGAGVIIHSVSRSRSGLFLNNHLSGSSVAAAGFE
jgi:hypothetical protein